MVVYGIVMFRHFVKKQPDKKRMRQLSIVLIILGFSLILWNPMFSLAKLNR
jgi:hypothetical protein